MTYTVNCAPTLHLPLDRMGEEDETFDRNTNISGCDKEFLNGFAEKGVDRQLQSDKGRGDPSLLMQVELQDGDTQFKVMETDGTLLFDTLESIFLNSSILYQLSDSVLLGISSSWLNDFLTLVHIIPRVMTL